MGGNYLQTPLQFLVEALLGLYVLALLLRFLLQLTRADFYNPLSQFLHNITRPVLQPLRRVVPGTPRVDGASLVALLLVQMLTLTIVNALGGAAVGPLALLFWSLAELVSLTLNVFLVTIIAEAVLSWVNPGVHNPVLTVLYDLNRPLLRPARRLLPPISGIDLSPLVVLLALQVAKMLLVPPLMALARASL